MKKMKSLVLALCSLAGPWQGKTVSLVNAKTPNWKAMHAEAIGMDTDDASDEDQIAAHHKHMAMVNDLGESIEADPEKGMAAANSKKQADESADQIEAEKQTGLENEKKKSEETALALANEKKRADDAALALANERKERAGELIGVALAAGRITPADKKQWEDDFTADFETAKTKLANAKAAVIKTKPQTAGLGERNETIANDQERSAKVIDLVNAKLGNRKDYNHAEYDAAFAAVRRENPVLFEAMKQPEPKK